MADLAIHGLLTLNAGENITITSGDGWAIASIKNNVGSTGNVTITGVSGRYIGNKPTGSIVLVPGESAGFGDQNGVIDNLKIETAALTTARIMCVAFKVITK